jgi:hypothetical protein
LINPTIYNIDVDDQSFQIKWQIEKESTNEVYPALPAKLIDNTFVVNSCSKNFPFNGLINFQEHESFFEEGWYRLELSLWSSDIQNDIPTKCYDSINNIRFRISNQEFAEVLLEDIYDIVNEIENMDLKEGHKNSLKFNIKNSILFIETGQYRTAEFKVNAFIVQVIGFNNGKILSDEQAEILVTKAEKLF